MKHPAEQFIKYLMIKNMAHMQQLGTALQEGVTVIPTGSNDSIMKSLDDWGFLPPQPNYLSLLRNSLPDPPPNFNPADRLNRPSIQYLREQKVYDIFFPSAATEEAWTILQHPRQRQIVEQVLMARCCNKAILQRINKKHNLMLTEEGVQTFGHYFWNVDLLTFDEWGRYLYDRSAMYADYMALLRAPPNLLFFKLQIEQQLESKDMIKQAQIIAFNNLQQVNLIPGTDSAKVKAIGVLIKSVVECDSALSASDAALSGVLKKFESFRMEHPQVPAPDIKQLAPDNTFSGSGVRVDKEKDKVH